MTDSAKVKETSFAEYRTREKFLALGRRYVNIFHQLHVINAGMAVLNKDFLTIPDEAVELLPELAGGAKLRQHIINLKDGTTPADKIDPDLLPFGEEVFDDKVKYEVYTGHKPGRRDFDSLTNPKPVAMKPPPTPSAAAPSLPEEFKPTLPGNLAADNARVIFDLLRAYQNTPADLEKFKAREEVKDFGPEWKSGIYGMLTSSDVPDKEDLKKIFDGLMTFDNALGAWQECTAIVKNPKDVNMAELKSKLAEYKKYLFMFGQGGKDMYDRIEAMADGA